MDDDDRPEPMFSSDFDPLSALEWCVDHVNQHHVNINQLIANNNMINAQLRSVTQTNAQMAEVNRTQSVLVQKLIQQLGHMERRIHTLETNAFK